MHFHHCSHKALNLHLITYLSNVPNFEGHWWLLYNALSAFETCSVSQPLHFHSSKCIGPKERIKKNVFSFYWETDNLWGPSHLWNFPLSQALCNRCTLQQAQFSLCLTGFHLKCLHLREKCRWDICSSCAVDKSLCNKVHTCISRYEQGNEK